MDALRKVYHRVVQIPVEGVDRLWQELESFENGLNKITVRVSEVWFRFRVLSQLQG